MHRIGCGARSVASAFGVHWHTPRKNQMSMHAFLPGTLFPNATLRGRRRHNGNHAFALVVQASQNALQSTALCHPFPPPTPGRGHPQTVTVADLPRLPIYLTLNEPVPALYPQPLIRDGFTDVMR
jgi:hypothetical protein